MRERDVVGLARLVDVVEVRGTRGGVMKGAQETQALVLELGQNREASSGVGSAGWPRSRPVWGVGEN